MSKFDRFGRSGDQGLPATTKSTGLTAGNAGARALLERASQGKSATASQITAGTPARVAIALDATGSMHELIALAKDSIAEITRRTVKEAGRRVEIQLFVYRDYDVPQQLLEKSAPSQDPEVLINWLGRIEALGGGGNSGEAVEAALQAIYDDGRFDVVLVAGDEPSNSRSNLNSIGRRQALTAQELAAKFGQLKKPIHTFVIDDADDTIRDFAALSKASGGQSGRLDGSREMTDMAVMAILSALKGGAAVKSYMEGRSLSANARDYGTLLLGHSK